MSFNSINVCRLFFKIMKVFLGLLVSAANAYFVEVDAHKEECFHEKVSAGTKVNFTVGDFFIEFL